MKLMNIAGDEILVLDDGDRTTIIEALFDAAYTAVFRVAVPDWDLRDRYLRLGFAMERALEDE